MKDLYDILTKDAYSDKNSVEIIVFGVIAPLALIAMCMFAEWLNSLY